MSFGFDPSIILANASKAPPESSLNDTLQTLSTLASQRTQQQHGQAQLADLLRQQQEHQQLADIYRQTAGMTPEEQAAALMRGGFGPQAYQAQDQASQMETAKATRQKTIGELQAAHRKEVGDMFFGVKSDADYQPRLEMLRSHPDPLMSFYAPFMPKKYEDNPDMVQRIGSMSLSAKEQAELADKAAAQAETSRHNKVTETKLGETERHDRAMEARLAAGAGMGGGLPNGLTQAALEKQVDAYEHQGALPPLGPGKSGAALRVAIMNRHAEKYPDSDLAGAKAGYTADSASLKNQQKLADQVSSFEKTAEKNLDTFLETANKVVDSGSPFFNAPWREFKKKFSGDPRMSGFEAARQTAVSEIGKVLQGGSGGAALTEGAREEVKHLISPDASLAQIKEAARILKLDMANRKKAVEETLQETRGRMSGKGAKETGATKGGGLSKAEADELKQLEKKYGAGK